MRKRHGDKGTGKQGDDASPQVSRREMMTLAAGAVVVPALPQTRKVGAAREQIKRHKFFTSDEFAMVDELSELIIPTDDHSPGARAAKCAEYIDARLSESPDSESKQEWRAGLKLIDRLSIEMHNMRFLKSSPDQRLALLTHIAQNETNAQKPEEKFFVELKSRVAHAYYTSKIGLRQELEYKGNTYLREFAGVDVSKS